MRLVVVAVLTFVITSTVPDRLAASQQTGGNDRNSVREQSTEAPEDFLDLESYGSSNHTFNFPTDREWDDVPFALIKMLLIVAGILFWLRILGATAADARTNTTDTEAPVSAIFITGFLGVLSALVLPAFIPATILLFGLSFVPFEFYRRRRNRLPEEVEAPLLWKHLLRTPGTRIRGPAATSAELPPDYRLVPHWLG